MRAGRTPTFWVLTTTALHMPEALAARWWNALTKARWSESVNLRQIMLLSRNTHGLYDPDGPVSPRRLVACLEALVGEGRMSRQDANRCMEYVLAQTGKDGQWAAGPASPSTAGDDQAPAHARAVARESVQGWLLRRVRSRQSR